MQTSDDTQPRKPTQGQNINQFPDQPTGHMVYAEDDEEMGGPGCIVWGIVGMFSVLLAGVLVIVSAFAGFNSGVTIARSNATATIMSDIQIQCTQANNNLADANVGLLQARINFLEQQTPVPDCLVEIIPSATAVYLSSLPTETPTPTQTSTATTTPSPAPTDIVEATATVIEATEPAYDYDMDGLLSEAQSQLSSQQYQDAIDTLDAIIAIDPNYQRTTVESLFFEAMTAEATRLFRTGKLAEGIVLTGRAEAYGDIQGLNYERFIAQLYLDAQRLKITNPAESVRLFNRIAYEQGLTNYLNGQVITELQEALVNYGNTLAERGDFCAARDQYNAALGLQPVASNISRGDVTGKRDSAATSCTTGAVATADGTSTGTDAGSTEGGTVATSAPVATERPTIVPVGQSGG